MNNSPYQYHQTRFVMSAPSIHQLPSDSGVEVAFVGRSNAGKSSALNVLTNQKNLARTSKTPGRTQLINLFEIQSNVRLVDLPGYGYAQVPEKIKLQWQKNLNEYLKMRQCLCGLVILMDIRHPLKETDQQLLKWAVTEQLNILILLTKTDKLSTSAQKKQLNIVREAILPFQGEIDVELFSALKKIGVDKLQNQLTTWFNAYLNATI